jgi:hypothetical protein
MSGQIVGASMIAAPRQCNTQEEKKAIKEGRIPEDWKSIPAKLRQKDRDARWTVKFTKAKPKEDGSLPAVDLAIPVFGYQSHISIDRGFGFIRKWAATDAAAYEGARLREGLLDKTNTASGVWADSRLSLSEERTASGRQRTSQPNPPQEAARQTGVVKAEWKADDEQRHANLDVLERVQEVGGIESAVNRRLWQNGAVNLDGGDVDLSGGVEALVPDGVAIAIQRDRKPSGLGHILGIVVELDLQAVREMMALFIDHHVPARDQEQTSIALEKKAARIR